ncbi:biotin-dependent carboxyltransferase family protein [Conexibacter sp. S30A1]|uniref:5-oxoprolinase subunit C family protein n=1 Tax=Conexibacter sp. S30A1 TaxID=2937800 RepID=UPI0020104158|nr:biotin-dependent carboxyltransferase family protein [Conexibacter sp. S30A1]
MTILEVISSGPLTTIQDLGRPGLAHIGVPRSGAADRPALRLANTLVGNRADAPALETTLIGPRLRVRGAVVIALTGAPVPARVGGNSIPMNTAVAIGDGEVLSIGTARTGLRTYVAFAGGIAVPLTLGSAATDLLTGIGPAPLAPGDALELGAASALTDSPRGGTIEETTHVISHAPHSTQPAGQALLQISFGQRDDWFTAAALRRLTADPFTVTPESGRIGLRLSGPLLERARDGELPSEGMIEGAIQVPPSGHPILLLTDHPTTGGYPVIATVLSGSLPLAAQLRPGQKLKFTTSDRAFESCGVCGLG